MYFIMNNTYRNISLNNQWYDSMFYLTEHDTNVTAALDVHTNIYNIIMVCTKQLIESVVDVYKRQR